MVVLSLLVVRSRWGDEVAVLMVSRWEWNHHAVVRTNIPAQQHCPLRCESNPPGQANNADVEYRTIARLAWCVRSNQKRASLTAGLPRLLPKAQGLSQLTPKTALPHHERGHSPTQTAHGN